MLKILSMGLSPRERQVVALLRTQPWLDAAGIASRLGTSKGAVAVVLSSLTTKGEILGRGYLLRDQCWAVVIGGAAWDIKACSENTARLHTSNPATVSRTPGGVGRNIAEGIARLGGLVHLVAAVGSDAAGRELIALTEEAGVNTEQVIYTADPTSTYLASLDPDGELVIGMADFAATDGLQVETVARWQDVIAQASVLVVDGNIPAAVVGWALAAAAASGVRVVVETVSVAKAARLAPLLNRQQPVFAITPNLAELSALVGSSVPDDRASIVAAAALLHDRGVDKVWVSRGVAGSLLVASDGSVAELSAAPARVVDVTGAGDALTAGFVHGLLEGADPVRAAERGHLAAAATVSSPHTVRPDLGAVVAAALNHDQPIGVTP